MNELSVYLNKATSLLCEYQWVYNFRATHLLANDILSNIPEIWVQTLLNLSDDDLSLLTSGIIKDGWPDCLTDFVGRCQEIRLPSASAGHLPQAKEWDSIPDKLRKGMCPKKQHEVLHLASFIYQQCNHSKLSRILDLGSGLGYLGKLLHHQSGYKVLGLEADVGHVTKAVTMQQPVCTKGVTHVALTLNPAHKKDAWKETLTEVRRALENESNWGGRCSCGREDVEETEDCRPKDDSEFPSSGQDDTGGSERSSSDVCLVSLHSCGDLSPTALRLFLKLPETKLLVLLSCCYHKMKTIHVETVHYRTGAPKSGKTRSEGSKDEGSEASVLAKHSYEVESDQEGNDSEGSPWRESWKESKRLSKKATLSEENSFRGPLSTHPYGASGSSKSASNCNSSVNRCVEKGDEFFPDFPMSAKLKLLVSTCREFAKRPLLRLASEITVEMWRLMTDEQRDKHAVHVMGRAVLELYVKIEGYTLKKKHRRGVRKSRLSNLDTYFEDALQRIEFLPISNAAEPRVADEALGETKDEACLASLEDLDGDRMLLSNRTPNQIASVGNHSSSLAFESNSDPSEGNATGMEAFSLEDRLSVSAIPFVDDCDSLGQRHSEDGREDSATGTACGSSDPVTCFSPELKVPVKASSGKHSTSHSAVTIESHSEKLKRLTSLHCTPRALRLTKALYAMHAAIQSIAEGYILADRLTYLMEQGGSFVDASLVRIFDRSLSPRSLAIVARKTDYVPVGGDK